MGFDFWVDLTWWCMKAAFWCLATYALLVFVF